MSRAKDKEIIRESQKVFSTIKIIGIVLVFLVTLIFVLVIHNQTQKKEQLKKEVEKINKVIPPQPVQWVLTFLDPTGKFDSWPMSASVEVGEGKILVRYQWNKEWPHREGVMVGLQKPNGAFSGTWQDWDQGSRHGRQKEGVFELAYAGFGQFKGWANQPGDKIQYPILLYAK